MSVNKRRSPFLANLDMYRKVPVDLLEGSKQGSLISWIALLVMIYLVVFETRDFLSSSLQTDLTLDPSKDLRVSVTFNITMLDLSCDFATIDVVSFLGTKQETNVTKNVQKWAVNAEGVAQSVVHRNKRQHDIRLSDAKVTKTIEELHDNGVHAVPLDTKTLQFALKEHEFVFIDFFASWCSHCQIFAPTWETLAEIMDDAAEQRMHSQDYKEHDYQYAKTLELPVFVGKVDCVLHNTLCSEQEITGFPTVRLYINGERYPTDYWGHRDVYNMMMFLKIAEDNTKGPARIAHAESIAKHRMNITDDEKEWAEKLSHQHHNTDNKVPSAEWNATEHPGCRLSGFLLLDRTPGHFYVHAQSPNHAMSPYMTNVSHIVHHLSFGDDRLFHNAPKVTSLPRPPNFDESTRPMNGNTYVTKDLHEAYHHYLKLVSTNLYSYQIVQSSQLSYYATDQAPEAKFIWDLSPISVTYRLKTRRWYDYITSLMAILGGTFTVVGMLQSGIRAATTRSRRSQPQQRPRG